jgi:hypothetical protein
MTYIRFIVCILFCASLAVSGETKNKFIGVKMCAMCHRSEKQGKQFDIWQKSKHAEAYKALTTDKANEFAKARGLTKPAAESPECLQCHVSAYNADASLVEANFNFKDGVQCETCHGAGSAYKNIPVMKDKAKAVAAGMAELKNAAAIEEFCRKCHNEKSPSYKEFKFEERWAKIKHPLPKG